MESLDTAAYFVDDLLNFSSDIEEDPNQKYQEIQEEQNLSQNAPQDTTVNVQEEEYSLPVLELQAEEEELEWLSNEDAFPKLESFELPLQDPKHQSPVSVLESSVGSCGLRIPVRARSKRGRRKWCGISDFLITWGRGERKSIVGDMKRKCLHCLAEKTPQWRAGPLGPKTLCNACGVRYKAGRLVPEYRPASSPSFSNDLHSNSHRKILEMRRKKLKGVENG
ncbi:GATA transcription factor 1 [Magnolia sinica]|uniref:GATA transcription factor 1 n=1 Tax=Magnolia sinica TaxID=86752 RepID=UPI00265ADF00|nr:GATA transcription factor 1 [Magnolia sinica]